MSTLLALLARPAWGLIQFINTETGSYSHNNYMYYIYSFTILRYSLIKQNKIWQMFARFNREQSLCHDIVPNDISF